MSRKTKVVPWIIALGGLWEFGDIAAAFVPGFGAVPALLWNHILVGSLLVLAGVWAALTHKVETAKMLDWIAGAAGVWLVIAAFILGDGVMAAGRWNDIIVGVMVVAAAGLLGQQRG